MNISPAYQIDRAVTISVLVVYLLVCAIQLCAAQRLRVVETKHYTHGLTTLSAIVFIVASVELGGVFHVLGGYLTYYVFFSIGINTISIILCLLIVNHFKASYLALKQEMPTKPIWILALSALTGFICTPVGSALAYQRNLNVYNSIAYLNGFQSILVMTFYDIWGYLKVRQLLIEMIQREKPDYRATVWCCSFSRASNSLRSASDINYEDLLNRINKFHAIFLILVLVYLSWSIAVVAVMFQNVSQPFALPDPSTYQFDFVLHVCVFALFLFTWWAWISPWQAIQGRDSQTSKATEGSRFHGKSDLYLVDRRHQDPRAHHPQVLSPTSYSSPSSLPPPESSSPPSTPSFQLPSAQLTSADPLLTLELEMSRNSVDTTPKRNDLASPELVLPSIVAEIHEDREGVPELPEASSPLPSPSLSESSSFRSSEDGGISLKRGSLITTPGLGVVDEESYVL